MAHHIGNLAVIHYLCTLFPVWARSTRICAVRLLALRGVSTPGHGKGEGAEGAKRLESSKGNSRPPHKQQ